MVWTSPRLTLTMLVVVPPIGIGVAWVGRLIRPMSRTWQDRIAEAARVAGETFGGIRTVRAFAQEIRETARYRAAVSEALLASRRRLRTIGIFMGIGSMVGYTTLVGVIWLGGLLVSEGSMTIGALTSFVLYALMVATSVGTLGSLWTDFMSASGAAERVFEIFDTSARVPLSGGKILDELTGKVEFQDVHFAYPTRPEHQVLRGISFVISPGETVAIVGPSGSGKTTIAALLARFHDPTSGCVKVDDEDLRQLDPSSLRSHYGVVFQEPVLLASTVEENIAYARPHASTKEIQDAADLANARTFIEALPQRWRTVVGERGIQLSGGQRQRIAIARAALTSPKILILDEATSALDSESEYLVQEALEKIRKGRTTLVIAHRLSTVVRADRILVLVDGRIVESGRHESLMEREGSTYRRLVERQHFTP